MASIGLGPQYGSRPRAVRYAGGALAGVLDIDVYGLSYGVRVAAGAIGC